MDVIVRRGITADRVCAEAGTARRTFYDQFETVELYVEQLGDYLETLLSAFPPRQPVGLTNTNGDLTETIRLLVTRELASGVELEGTLRALRLLGRTPKQGEAGSPWRELVLELLELGFESADDLSAADLAEGVDQLVIGFLATTHADFDASSARLVRHIEQLFEGLVDPTSEDGSTSQTRNARIRAAWAESASGMPIPNVQRLVVQAAKEIIVESGAESLTIGSISRSTGLSRSSIVRLAGGVRRVLGSVVDEVAPGLDLLIRSHLAAGQPPMEVLHSHILRSVTATRTLPAYAAATVALGELEGQELGVSASLGRAALQQSLAEILSATHGRSAPTTLAGLLEHLTCVLPRLLDGLDDRACTRLIVEIVSSNEFAGRDDQL